MPVEIVNADGNGDVVLICEHSGKLIPRALDGLGLDPEVRSSHVAWDPGAEPVARQMAALLDAPLVLQRFSRLVYDCNRPPDAESAIPARSEVFDIPGNAALTAAERRLRTDALYRPFRKDVAALLDRRTQQGKASAVVTIHSFTPVYFGKPREVELGFLHDTDSALADAMLVAASAWLDLTVRRNQPYGPEDGVTHTLQVDGIARGLPNVMIEIRNDLIQTPDQQAVIAARLAELVGISLTRLPMNQGLRGYGTAG
ncbi:MAG: N-formylglutamate amidohydrolase [Geminicoccaceae bacterium]